MKLHTAILLALSLGVTAPVYAAGSANSTEERAEDRYDATKDAAKERYEAAKENCETLSGDAKDSCMKDAKAAYTEAKADAKAQEKSTKAQGEAGEEKMEATMRRPRKNATSFPALRKTPVSMMPNAPTSSNPDA